MRTTRTALAITVMALIGLVVSVTAAWPQLSPDTSGEGRLRPPAARIERASDERNGSRPESPSVNRVSAEPSSKEPLIAVPETITLADVGIDAAVRPVGVAADGQMQLPPDPRRLGWYRFGPVPGPDARGSAVVAGHLDSRQHGLGPLVRLRDVQTGDPVQVTLSDGSHLTYRVAGVDRYDQQALPDDVFARTGAHRLSIVTCGGDYDANHGGYQQNLVVTAVPA